MQSLVKIRILFRGLTSFVIRENIHKTASAVVCCNYHAVVNNESELIRYQLHNPITSNFHVRFKSKKKYTKPELYSDDEDEGKGDDHNEILGVNEEIKTVKAQSLRIEQLFKLAFNTSRTKVEKAFFENRFRVNGEKVKKKSASAQIGDEVDLIKGFSRDNHDFLEVNRIEVLECKPNETMDGVIVKLRKSKNLIVENYPHSNAWKEAEEET